MIADAPFVKQVSNYHPLLWPNGQYHNDGTGYCAATHDPACSDPTIRRTVKITFDRVGFTMTIAGPVERTFASSWVRPLDFSIVGAGVRLVLGADGTCSDARIGLNGAADRPLRAKRAEAALWGHHLDSEPEAIEAAADLAAADSDPVDDIDGSADYKRKMVRVYVRRAVRQSLSMARAG